MQALTQPTTQTHTLLNESWYPSECLFQFIGTLFLSTVQLKLQPAALLELTMAHSIVSCSKEEEAAESPRHCIGLYTTKKRSGYKRPKIVFPSEMHILG